MNSNKVLASALIVDAIIATDGLCKAKKFYDVWVKGIPTNVRCGVRQGVVQRNEDFTLYVVFTPAECILWLNTVWCNILEQHDQTTETRLWLEETDSSTVYAESFMCNVYPKLCELGVI